MLLIVIIQESLMKDLTDTTDEDEIVTSNEQLNPLLARSDEELEIFQKMDEEQEAQVRQNTLIPPLMWGYSKLQSAPV